jgi:hypothetical protein
MKYIYEITPAPGIMGIIINEKVSRILILASDKIATAMQIWEMEMKSINTYKLKNK